jgi:hypothetical protein
MEQFYPLAIIELQNILSPKSIGKLKSEFLRKNYHSEDSPDFIDSDKGILYQYDGHKDGIVSKKFENYLKEILWNTTNKLKAEIDLSRIKLNQAERVKYWEEIMFSLDRINDSREELINKYPVIKKVFIEIDNYFNEKYGFQTEEYFDNGFFKLKNNYSQKDIIKIYDFLIYNEYLDGHKYTKDDFLAVLFSPTTEIIIEFDCFTYIIVTIFENLKELFEDMTQKDIGESGRFKTKSGKTKPSEILNSSNYSRVKNSLKDKEQNKDIIKVNKFFSLNFPN